MSKFADPRFWGDTIDRAIATFAQAALADLGRASPHSVEVTLQLFAAGQWSSLGAALARELEAARAILRHPDFVEGVRAVLVDKTRDPAWQPAAPPPDRP